jgi:probable rRNA maturation factor
LKPTNVLRMSEPSLQHQIDIQWAIDVEPWMPAESDLTRWALEVLNAPDNSLYDSAVAAEICVRVVGELEIQNLNRDYREMDKVTNVLAFPQVVELEDGTSLLGDIVVCAPVVATEASAQGKEPQAHFAHLVVHGVLHLLGYDHIEDLEAVEMESIEVRMLKGLGIDDPYREAQALNQ